MSKQIDAIFNKLSIPAPDTPPKLGVISTGSSRVDHEILQVGGVPRGRITHVYGEEHGGKTSFAMRIVAMAQKQYPDELVVWLDTERTFDFDFARLNGVNVDDATKFRYHAITSAEDVLDLLVKYSHTNVCSLIVLDSLGGSDVTDQLTANALKSTKQVAAVPRLVTTTVRNIQQAIDNEKGAAILVTNQVRDKIGVLYGNPETFPGGKALKHAATLNIRISKKQTIGEEGIKLGLIVKKNKKGFARSTGDDTHLTIYYGADEGVLKTQVIELFNLAVIKGYITKRGGWYYQSNNEAIKWHGQDKVLEALTEDANLREEFTNGTTVRFDD